MGGVPRRNETGAAAELVSLVPELEPCEARAWGPGGSGAVGKRGRFLWGGPRVLLADPQSLPSVPEDRAVGVGLREGTASRGPRAWG